MVGTLGVLAGAGLALTFLLPPPPPALVPALTGGRGQGAVGPRTAGAPSPYR